MKMVMMMMRRKNIHYNIYSDWAGFGMVRVYCAFSIAHLQNGMRWIRQEMGKWNEKNRQMSSMKYSIQWRWFDWTQIQLEQASKRAGRQASIHDMHRTCRNIVFFVCWWCCCCCCSKCFVIFLWYCVYT